MIIEEIAQKLADEAVRVTNPENQDGIWYVHVGFAEEQRQLFYHNEGTAQAIARALRAMVKRCVTQAMLLIDEEAMLRAGWMRVPEPYVPVPCEPE